MTKHEQMRFVNSLLGSIKDDIRRGISNGDIPATWDGIELREYVFELARRARRDDLLAGARGRDYRNTIITTNL